MTARAVPTVASFVAMAACTHYHRGGNAPGITDIARPPTRIADPSPEYPGESGEHMLTVSSGVLAGVGGGSIESGAVGDFAGEITVSYGDSPFTHNDLGDPALFLPRGLLLPTQSYGVTLGWSALRIASQRDGNAGAITGPLYLEVQGSRLIGGGGVGWAVDLKSGKTGPQFNAFFMFLFARGRVLFGDGWEVVGGLQFKFPVTWVWRR